MTMYQIRDDIIDVDTYCKAEIHYKKYLELLYDSGYYCFQSQWSRWIKNPKILTGMVEAGLVAVDPWCGRYNVIRLTQTALKYLLLRNSPIDAFAGKTKDKISVRTIAVRPENRPLLSAAMRFELICKWDQEAANESRLSARGLITREGVVRSIDRAYAWKRAQLGPERFESRRVDLDYDVKQLKKLVLNLFDKSKVIVVGNPYLEPRMVEVVILDVSQREGSSYKKLIDRANSLYGRIINNTKLSVSVVSPNKSRAAALYPGAIPIDVPELKQIYDGKIVGDHWIKPRDTKIATAIRDRVTL